MAYFVGTDGHARGDGPGGERPGGRRHGADEKDGHPGKLSPNNLQGSAGLVKDYMDKKYGPYWHVIIGKGYSFDITIQERSLLFMYFDGSFAIMVFKSG